jgi:hypothetical protein
VLHVAGNATLGGTLNVQPSTGYAASANTGDDIPFALYFGTQSGSFSTVSVIPPLNSGKPVTVDTSEPGEIEAIVGKATIGPVNTALPLVSGSAIVGQTLATTNGSWTGNPTSFGYQWSDCDAAGNGCVAIASATSSTYKVTSSDIHHTLRVVVFAANGGGVGAAASLPTAVVPAPKLPRPAISGAALTPTSFTASKGTKLTLTLNTAATIKVVIYEKGHVSGGKCSTSAKTGKKCRVKKKTFTFNGKAGFNSFKLKTKGLSAGSYVAVVTASNSTGGSKQQKIGFTIT